MLVNVNIKIEGTCFGQTRTGFIVSHPFCGHPGFTFVASYTLGDHEATETGFFHLQNGYTHCEIKSSAVLHDRLIV